MLKYKLDNITKQDKKIIAYVNIMDGTKIIKSICLNYNDKESFKKILKAKTANIKAEYNEQEAKKIEIEKILEGM